MLPTQQRIKEVLSFDKETGIFTWKNPSKNNRKLIGKIAGSNDGHGYLRIRIDGQLYLSHRLAWMYVYGEEPEKYIDHINGISTDNSINNLRLASNSENQQNIKNKTNKLMGASFSKRTGMWRSMIRADGKQIYIGSFKTEEEAHRAYVETKKKVHKFQNTLRK